MAPPGCQHILSRYVDRDDLIQFMIENFGSTGWEINLRHNHWEITAPRRITDAEELSLRRHYTNNYL